MIFDFVNRKTSNPGLKESDSGVEQENGETECRSVMNTATTSTSEAG